MDHDASGPEPRLDSTGSSGAATAETPGAVEQELLARIATADQRCHFGPSFFLTRLRVFVREQCPDPTEALPSVRLHLGTGDVFDICHVVGVAPSWVALAVPDDEARGHPMRTELVPYELIVRVTIRGVRPTEARVGFSDRHMRVLAEHVGEPNAEGCTMHAGTPED